MTTARPVGADRDGATAAGLVQEAQAFLAELHIQGRESVSLDSDLVADLALDSLAIVLHEHVSRALGVGIFTPEGDRLVALGMLDLYSHKLIDGTFNSVAETRIDVRGANSGRCS